MRIGVDVNITGPLAQPENVLQMGRLVEDLGYDFIWVSDHIVRPMNLATPYPYNETGEFALKPGHNILDPLTSLAALAAITSRPRLGIAVMVAPYRNPVLVTKALTTVDVFSGGRVTVGVGAGWMEEEFQALASPPFAQRGKVTDEYIQIYKALCTQERATFEGQHYRLPEISFQPKPVQQPHPPILVGGTTPPALRRAARLGDGWFSANQDPPSLQRDWQQVLELCAQEGRDPSGMQLALKATLSLGERITLTDGSRLPLSGTPDEVLDDLRRYQEVGLHDLCLRYRGTDFQEQVDQIMRLAELVPEVSV